MPNAGDGVFSGTAVSRSAVTRTVSIAPARRGLLVRSTRCKTSQRHHQGRCDEHPDRSNHEISALNRPDGQGAILVQGPRAEDAADCRRRRMSHPPIGRLAQSLSSAARRSGPGRFANFRLQRPAVHAKQPRGGRDIALSLVERLLNVLPLEPGEGNHGAFGLYRLWVRLFSQCAHDGVRRDRLRQVVVGAPALSPPLP